MTIVADTNIPSVPGFEDDIIEFHYTRSFPVEEYHRNELMNLEDDTEVHPKSVITMSSRKYVDVFDCFSPMYV